MIVRYNQRNYYTKEGIYLDDRQFKAAMDSIVAALEERGYDPYAQLYGYVMKNDPIYITSHNNARILIQALDFEKVREYVREMKG